MLQDPADSVNRSATMPVQSLMSSSETATAPRRTNCRASSSPMPDPLPVMAMCVPSKERTILMCSFAARRGLSSLDYTMLLLQKAGVLQGFI